MSPLAGASATPLLKPFTLEKAWMSHDMAEWARRLLPFGCALLLAGCATYEPKPIAPATMATVFESRPLADTRLQTFLQAEEGTPANSSGWNLHTLTLA